MGLQYIKTKAFATHRKQDGTSKNKKIIVEYLALDLHTCQRCVGTDTVLEEVIKVLEPALQLAGYEIELRKILIESAETAAANRLEASPTIRINGRDICSCLQQNSCACCSNISGTAVDCRIFLWNNVAYETPPKEMLAEEIFKGLFAPSEKRERQEYRLPQNLIAFFEGKASQTACTCNDTDIINKK